MNDEDKSITNFTNLIIRQKEVICSGRRENVPNAEINIKIWEKETKTEEAQIPRISSRFHSSKAVFRENCAGFFSGDPSSLLFKGKQPWFLPLVSIILLVTLGLQKSSCFRLSYNHKNHQPFQYHNDSSKVCLFFPGSFPCIEQMKKYGCLCQAQTYLYLVVLIRLITMLKKKQNISFYNHLHFEVDSFKGDRGKRSPSFLDNKSLLSNKLFLWFSLPSEFENTAKPWAHVLFFFLTAVISN